jgi:MFS transporter, Spinster family, sphingosine-1-phosphate transporter
MRTRRGARRAGEGHIIMASGPEPTRDNATTPSLPVERTAAARQARKAPGPAAAWVLWLLFSINVVNYLDRLLVVAVGPTIKAQFHLTDWDIGRLSSAFLIVYTLASLPLGLLADRVARGRVVAVGVALWSVMSGATAFTRGFAGLFVTRTAVGVGEASYFPAGLALLSAYYPLRERARAISQWGAGQIVGAALAFAVSAACYHWLGGGVGWRVAFLVAAVPGLALAALMWPVPDGPGAARAARSPVEARASGGGLAGETWPVQARAALAHAWTRVRAVLRIRTVVVSIMLQALIYIAVTPTVTFLTIYIRSSESGLRLNDAQAALVSGVVIVVGGLAGTLSGGYVADWLGERWRGGRLLTVAVGCGVGLPCYVAMLLTHSMQTFIVVGTLAVLALNLQVGPLGAVVQDATPPGLRASAVAVGLLAAHLLGDAWAPTAAGGLSTALGGRTNVGLLLVGAPALLVGVVVAIVGARIYAADVERRTREAMVEPTEV